MTRVTALVLQNHDGYMSQCFCLSSPSFYFHSNEAFLDDGFQANFTETKVIALDLKIWFEKGETSALPKYNM